MDPIFLIERQHGSLGREIIGHPENTRSWVVSAVLGDPSIVRVFELRADENHCEDITDAIWGEAEQARRIW